MDEMSGQTTEALIVSPAPTELWLRCLDNRGSQDLSPIKSWNMDELLRRHFILATSIWARIES